MQPSTGHTSCAGHSGGGKRPAILTFVNTSAINAFKTETYTSFPLSLLSFDTLLKTSKCAKLIGELKKIIKITALTRSQYEMKMWRSSISTAYWEKEINYTKSI